MDLVVEGRVFSAPAAVWLGLLIDVAVKGTLIAGGAWLIAGVAARAPAVVRSRVWTVAFVLLAILPLVVVLNSAGGTASATRGIRLPVTIVEIVAESTAGQPALPAAAGDGPAGVANRDVAASGDRGIGRAATIRPHRVPLAVTSRLVSLFVLTWFVVALVLAVRLARRINAGRSVVRSSRPVVDGPLVGVVRSAEKRLGISRPVAIRVGNAVSAPFVAGMFRQQLCLPEAALYWRANDLRRVLLHELAHVRRRDLLRLVLTELATAFHWFNPVVWRAARRARLAIEMACDDVVCGDGTPAVDYARQLVLLAGRMTEPARVPGMAVRPGLEDRIRNIITPGRGGRLSRTRRLLAAVLAGVLTGGILLPVSGFRTVAPAVDQPVFARSERAVPAGGGVVPHRPVSIHQAAAAGDLGTLGRLLETDPSLLNAPDERRMTPLAVAAWNDRHEAVAYLLDRGADPDIRNHNGLTPLFCALDRSRPETARLLLAAGADPSLRGYRGRSLLHMAARSGDAGMIRELVARGLDVNATDADGYTPLDLVTWRPNPAIAGLLDGMGARTSGLPAPPSYKPKTRKTA